MRRLLLAIALATGLTACNPQTLSSINTALQFGTVGVNNPVTKEQLYAVENGMIVVFAALNAYRSSCVRGAIPPSCKDTIRKIQVYTKRIPAQLTIVRRFVRQNDQVNAALAFSTLVQLITAAKGEAAAGGVPVNG